MKYPKYSLHRIPVKQRNHPFAESEQIGPYAILGLRQVSSTILQRKYGAQLGIPTLNNWQNRHTRANPPEPLRKWYRNHIKTSERYSLKQLQNGYLLINPGIMLSIWYQGHQKLCEPRYILCLGMNRRSSTTSWRKTCERVTYGPLNHRSLHLCSL